MGILRNFINWRRFVQGSSALRIDDVQRATRDLRACRFEQLEDRKLMAGDVHLGAVYYEPASGDDSTPNLIQVTFQGGVPSTQLTQIVIDGDKNHDGKYSSGEIFFDTDDGGMGEFGHSPFKIVDSSGFTVTGWSVVDGGQKLVIDLTGFDPGEKLTFSIDVDEVQFVDAGDGGIDVNSLVEGNEFQRSILTGYFHAPHFEDANGSALFWDAYDKNFANANASAGSTLNLPKDSYIPPSNSDQTDLTAGAVLTLKQVPLPITIGGKVYHDRNKSNSINVGEQGIANVTLTLLQWNGSQWVSTGKTTETDTQGNYKFTAILPGTYRVSETQPSGWLSVSSQPGTVDGAVDGISLDPDNLANIILVGGQDGMNYNFGESLPNSISGYVHADPEGDCEIGPNDIMLKGVKIDLLDAQGKVIGTTFTDENGFYKFDNLGPGTYGIREYTPDGYFDSEEEVGSLGGVHSANDEFTQIVTLSGD
ncbi:MAG: hypothetical protein IT427_06755, partial [Pirellulales bacterium]|nr:hypothetical protein [Pirellulales bacterium]